MKAILTVIILSLFSVNHAGKQLTINFKILPELKEVLKDLPIQAEFQFNGHIIDTILTNPSTITFTNVRSKYAYLNIRATAPCTDGVSKKYFRVAERLQVDKNVAFYTVTFPLDCKINKYMGGSICPACNKRDQSIPILWGLRFDDKGVAGVDYMLGGCVKSACDPNWFCKRDSVEF